MPPKVPQHESIYFAIYSKPSIISASQFDTQCLKILNKASEYIMQIVLKACVIIFYDILGIHFHAMRSCKDVTTTKKQNLVEYSLKIWHQYIKNLK